MQNTTGGVFSFSLDLKKKNYQGVKRQISKATHKELFFRGSKSLNQSNN
jgi:hypothetical protein